MRLPRQDWILVGHIPARIEREQFEQVQAKLALNKERAGRNNKAHTYLLRNLVSCDLCKLACSGQNRRGYAYYICHGRGTQVSSCLDQRCAGRVIPMKGLDEVVWQDVYEVLTQPALIKQALERAQSGHWLPQELQARRSNLNKTVQSLAKQIERLTQAYLEKIMGLEEYRRRRQELEQKATDFQAQIRQLELSINHRQELTSYIGCLEEFCQRIGQGLAKAEFEQKRRILELVIERIVVTREEVEIRYIMPLTARGEQTKFIILLSSVTTRI